MKYIVSIVSVFAILLGTQAFAAHNLVPASLEEQKLSRDQIMERWRAMSPEDREKIKRQMRERSKDRWNAMSSEEQDKVRARREVNRKLRQRLSNNSE